MSIRRVALLVALILAVSGVCATVASAEHPASRATFESINRILTPSAKSLDDHLKSVEVSSVGPYALAFEAGGQDYRGLLKEKNGRWRYVADVTISTAFSCSAAPAAVIRDLHILQYLTGHRCEQ